MHLEDGSLLLGQEEKLNDIIKNFDLGDSKPSYAPMRPYYYNIDSKTNELKDSKNYRKAVGPLLFISIITWPDISMGINMLGRRNCKPR